MKKILFPFAFLLLWMSNFAQQGVTHPFINMPFRFIGPDGNRTIAVVGEPGNPMVSYVGAASGGIFKTIDGGVNWRPIFDDMDNASIGALAIAEGNHNQVWAGTGETFVIRPAHANGNGIYKSSDGGKTWKNRGLKETVLISKVIVDPTDTNTVYVAAMGHMHGPQNERGVYKTTDGGLTWNQILFVDALTGCSDLSINLKNPKNLVAAMWQVEIKTWNLNSGGPGSGFYKTMDGGKTWQVMNNGLPGGVQHPIGKTSIDFAQSNPNTIYALVEDKAPGLYKSVDAGEHWKLMYESNSMAQRAPYYTRVRVSTQDENKLYTICVTIMESIDGGKTFNGNGTYTPGGDNHDVWFDPKNANRIMVAHDLGMNMSFNGGKSWSNLNLPIAQMYHVAVDEMVPYHVMGNRQDGYSYRTSAISMQGAIPLGLWEGVGGCESGFAQPDPFDPNIIYSGCYDGGLDVTDVRTGLSHDIRAWPEAGFGWAPADMKYRWHWNFPMVVSKHQKGVVYVGSQYVHKTNNRGMSWKIISPDLTTNDKSHQQNSGGMNSDNLMTFDGCTLYVIAESPLQSGVLWTGTNDGQINVTTNDGKTWNNVTSHLKNIAPWGTIRSIEPSHFSVGTAYITISYQQLGDFKPYIFKTTDFGNTWTAIGTGIPASNSSFVHTLKEDPTQKGLLFAGTDNGLYISPNDGNTWVQLKNNLPPAPIYYLAIQKNFRDLVIATYGRGFYILDDITPIRVWSKDIAKNKVELIAPRPAYRFNNKPGIHNEGSLATGSNPPYGASINYFLPDITNTPLFVFILNQKGDTIKTIKGTNNKGVNRVWWNLAHDEIILPPLKTKPDNKDFVVLDKEGNRNLNIYDLDIGPGMEPIKVPAGLYSVVLKVGGFIQKQNLTVLKDPNIHSNDIDIQQQYKFGLDLNKHIKLCLSMIATMETKRAQLLKEATVAALTQEKTLYLLEAQLFDIHLTGARMDVFRNPAKLLERMLTISKESQTYGADFAPTQQQQQVFNALKTQLYKVEAAYKQLK
ncbi:MAG: glycosyl hydrolase [Chitinophagia bacterium]